MPWAEDNNKETSMINRYTKSLAITLFFSVSLLITGAGSSWGADLSKGLAAYDRGDYATAVRELEPLAIRGNAEAQYVLGCWYHKGHGVIQNYEIAVQLFSLAAEQGFSLAMVSLAAIYGDGRGVTQDYVYAHMWANIAASTGLKLGIEARDQFEARMTSEQVERAHALALECKFKKYKDC